MLANALTTLAQQSGLEILERCDLAGRAATCREAPQDLYPTLRALLRQDYPQGLYAHQTEAIAAILAGEDVCIATPTASGKSLVFMTAAAHVLKSQPDARVLAIYPAKALIQDQRRKWQDLLGPLHLSAGYLDGSVPVAARAEILATHPVVLMTPDVAHAWLMSHLENKAVRRFVQRLKLLILDESHVYDGVFGSNMAYFLRRLQAVAPIQRIISSTATTGNPAEFLDKLTGRRPRVFGAAEDGSARPDKTLLLGRMLGDNTFEQLANLLRALAQAKLGRFLAFGDSRKMVEQLVAAVQRQPALAAAEAEDATAEENGPAAPFAIMPYRAGYEEEDRLAIQGALERGQLAGVVATSALELGLDIGEIDLVLLLSIPPTIKAFWQRFGRAGRVRPAVCLLLDNGHRITGHPEGLAGYLQKAPEPSWLYLDNRYIQYANALCAAAEAATAPGFADAPFQTLPADFLDLLRNELNPAEAVPAELYPLKQRAQNGPHHEFPLRSGIEKQFEVHHQRGSIARGLGTLTYSQLLREAYPGAIYYYMAQPYRVSEFRYASGRLGVKGDRHYTTQPLWQSMVFPKFQGGMLQLLSGPGGFLAEVELQVSERVTGFVEQRGRNRSSHVYAPGSPYAQRPITRFFETTGVCWYLPTKPALNEAIGDAVVTAFCALCGVHSRDLGYGVFHANASPLGPEPVQGLCVYDATHGSLRLTQRLAERFAEVLDLALTSARSAEPRDEVLAQGLAALRDWCGALQPAAITPSVTPAPASEDWVTVVVGDQPAMLRHPSGDTEEVKVTGYRYTPRGLLYSLVHPREDTQWQVAVGSVTPINGVTRLEQFNLVTGETRPLAA